MNKRLISIIVCLMLLIGLMPASVFAAHTTEITEVKVNDIDHPIQGRVLDTTYSVPQGAPYTPDPAQPNVVWYDQGTSGFKSAGSGTELVEGAKAIAGHYYVAKVTLRELQSAGKSDNGGYFSDNVTVSHNKYPDRTWDIRNVLSNDKYQLKTYLYFKADNLYSDIILTADVPELAIHAGETPWPASAFSGYDKNDFTLSVNWYKGTEVVPKNKISNDTQFIGGQVYTLAVTLNSEAKYKNGWMEDYTVVWLNNELMDTKSISATQTVQTMKFTASTVLNEADIEGVQAIEAGGTPQITGFTGCAGTDVMYLKWTDKFGNAFNGSFAANTEYILVLSMTPQSGYKLDLSTNSVYSNLGSVTNIAEDGNGGYTVYISLTTGSPQIKDIDSIALSITAPKEGNMPSYGVPDGDGYYVAEQNNPPYYYGVAWYDIEETTGLNDTDQFQGGHAYKVFISLNPKTGYQFACNNLGTPTLSVTVNGNNATVSGGKSNIMVSYNFDALPPSSQSEQKKEVSSVHVGVYDPSAGKHPQNTVSFDSLDGWKIDTENVSGKNGMAWYEMSAKGYNFKSKEIKDTEYFEAGKIYMAEIYLRAEDGYIFSKDMESDYSKATIGGDSADYVKRYTDQRLMVCKIFDELEDKSNYKVIQDISITIDEPKPGNSPAYEFTCNSDQYVQFYMTDEDYINGMLWMEFKKNPGLIYDLKPGELEKIMQPTDKFEAGKIYGFIAYTKATKGNTFAEEAMLNGTVNGKSIMCVGMNDYGITGIVFEPLKEVKLDYIKISKAPTKKDYKVGEEFDPSGMVITAVYDDKSEKTVENYTYTPNGQLTADDITIKITYKEGDISKSVNQKITVAKAKTPTSLAITTQPAKTEYKVGETFNPGGMVVTVTYTDKSTAEVQNYNYEPAGKLTENDSFVTITYTENQITRTADVPIKVSKQTALVNPFTDVFDSDYYYDAVLWAYYHDPQITDGTSKNHFSPKATCTRGQVVTFLWRAAGKPEPTIKANPFSDVKETDFFYKPTLWAFEKGITQYASEKNKSFAPYQTCSTMHIATFLYRSVNYGADGWGDVARNWALSHGLADNTGLEIKIGEDCPRSAVVTFLYRYYEGK